MKGKGFGFKFFQLLVAVVLVVVSYVLVFVSPVFAADKPVWRILWIILLAIDYQPSEGERMTLSMTSNDLEVCQRMAQHTEVFLEEGAKGAVDFELTVQTSDLPITSMSGSPTTGLHVDVTDLPTDIQDHIASANHAGNPYHLLIATARTQGGQHDPRTGDFSGLNSGYYSYVQLYPGYHYDWYDVTPDRPYPELVWIHELLHSLESHYWSLGYAMADIHKPEDYGFAGLEGLTAYGNQDFYRAFLSGNLYDSSGKQVGITPDMWTLKPSSTTPTPPTNPTPDNPTPDNPTPPSPTPPAPTNSNDGGGGCDTGLSIYALLALLTLQRKRS